jgi:peptidoglycan L-alanyl-D-glutamate endopeptidase CwlK
MGRRLDELSATFRPLAVELLARAAEAGIPVLIVCTGRTWEEHQQALLQGRSWTRVSKHLDGAAFRGTEPGSDAIDIVPYEVYRIDGHDKLLWDPTARAWERLGEIGEALGLRWGGRWTQRDLGHFELVRDHASPGGD